MGIHWRSVVGVVVAIVWVGSLASVEARQGHLHAQSSQTLVDVVREAIQPFSQPSAAEDADYHPFAGCVAGATGGAMGVHYVNGNLVGDGVIDEQHPEALIYEPDRNGRLQLVAVEFIVIAAQWDAAHTDNSPPTLRGQVFQFNGAPNRYRLPPFYELHVWAAKDNPDGAYADWNPHVSCDAFATQ